MNPRRAAALLPLLLLACDGAENGATFESPSDTLLAVGGTELFVHQEGSGLPLVVVHGGPVLDHGYLVEPLAPLGDSRRLVFFDQRLSGRSAGAVDSASVRLDTLVADLEALRTELGLARIDLLGHSWGGLLAIRYALLHPDRLRSLILVSPMAPSAELWREEQALLQSRLSPEDTAGMGELAASPGFQGGEPAAVERMLQLSFRGQLADPSLADSLRFHIPADYRERSRQFGFLLPDLLTYDFTDALAKLTVPTLVVYGAQEPGMTVAADTLERLLPDVRVERIQGAGHFPFLERPDRFRSALVRFLGNTDP